MFSRKICVGAVAALGFCAPAFAGPEWVEGSNGTGDAGGTVGGAQRTAGPNQLSRITGALGFPTLAGVLDQEDMYLIEITEPLDFTMTVVSADFNAQLFVFNVTLPGEGFGLLANDDGFLVNQMVGFTNPFLSSFSTDDSGASINAPGVYAIAISGFGRNPVSNGGLIYNMEDVNEVSGPDGPGGLLPHTGWAGEGQTGTYKIDFTATDPIDEEVPAPGALALLGVAGLAGASRRRKA